MKPCSERTTGAVSMDARSSDAGRLCRVQGLNPEPIDGVRVWRPDTVRWPADRETGSMDDVGGFV